jgi:tRNA threonylcarbamoyladenosine biosynthesis protein TsaB
VPADQAAPEYVRDKVAQTTAERVAQKAEKAARAEQAGRTAEAARHSTPAQNAHDGAPHAAPHGEGRQ